MIGALTLNGQEVEATFGLIVTGYGGDLGTAGRTINLLNVPALAGGLDPGIVPNEAPRVLSVSFMVSVATDALLPAALDAIKEVCGTGLVQIRTLYSTTRALYGVLQPFDVTAFQKTIPGWASGTMTFLCPCPYWLALTSDVISFGATAVDIPLGTAPSVGRDDWSAILEITGAATTPTITYLDSAGNTIGTVVVTYSLAAGDTLRIDLGRRLVQRRVSGTWSDAWTYLTAGYTLPALDPADGSFDNALWPKLKVSSGSGQLYYTKHYR